MPHRRPEDDTPEQARKDVGLTRFEYAPGRFRQYFTTPFEQYREHVGKPFRVLRQVQGLVPDTTEDLGDDGEEGQEDVYEIEFEDGTRIDAFGHEVCVLADGEEKEKGTSGRERPNRPVRLLLLQEDARFNRLWADGEVSLIGYRINAKHGCLEKYTFESADDDDEEIRVVTPERLDELLREHDAQECPLHLYDCFEGFTPEQVVAYQAGEAVSVVLPPRPPSVDELEGLMSLADDTRKEFVRDKDAGLWRWRNRGDAAGLSAGFPTFLGALYDAVDPYLVDPDEGSETSAS